MVASTEEVWEVFWTYHGWFALYERYRLAFLSSPFSLNLLPLEWWYFALRLKIELPSWAKMRMVDPKEPLEAQVKH